MEREWQRENSKVVKLLLRDSILVKDSNFKVLIRLKKLMS